MSLPEIWDYERQQAHFQRPLLRLVDSKSNQPIAGIKIVAMPRPAIYPLGMPANTTYTTDQNGTVSLDKLPSGSESWVSIAGETSIPLTRLLKDFETKSGQVRIEHLKR